MYIVYTLLCYFIFLLALNNLYDTGGVFQRFDFSFSICHGYKLCMDALSVLYHILRYDRIASVLD